MHILVYIFTNFYQFSETAAADPAAAMQILFAI